MMRHLDLFSGIGGFALAARMAGGFKTVAFCEIDKYCQRVLRKNFPNIPIHDNVKTLNGNEYGPIDIITGGYPCQPFSHAGKRSGANDDRHLWPEVFRVARSIKPRWLLLENVAGHITLGLDDVLSDLDSIGYTSQPFIVPACAVDAKHRRDRVWIVANSNSLRMEGAWTEQQTTGIGGKSEAMANTSRIQPEREEQWAKRKRTWKGGESFNVSNANGAGCEKQRFTITDEKEDAPAECSRWWESEPAVGRVANGVPNRVDRLRGLGNAIAPQVAAVILEFIKQTDQYFYQS